MWRIVGWEDGLFDFISFCDGYQLVTVGLGNIHLRLIKSALPGKRWGDGGWGRYTFIPTWVSLVCMRSGTGGRVT